MNFAIWLNEITIAAKVVKKAMAILVGSTIGSTCVPSGPTVITATGRPMAKPPPPPPPHARTNTERTPASAEREHPLGHILTRVLGTEEDVEVDVCEGEIVDGDVFLLCSDGLSDLVQVRSGSVRFWVNLGGDHWAAHVDVVDLVALDGAEAAAHAADDTGLFAMRDVVVSHDMMADVLLGPTVLRRPFDCLDIAGRRVGRIVVDFLSGCDSDGDVDSLFDEVDDAVIEGLPDEVQLALGEIAEAAQFGAATANQTALPSHHISPRILLTPPNR